MDVLFDLNFTNLLCCLGASISCLCSWGRGRHFVIHIGTSDGAVLLYRVVKKQTQNHTDFFESSLEKKRVLAKGKKDGVSQLEVIQDSDRLVACTTSGIVQVMSADTLDIEETLPVKDKVDKIVTEKMSPLMGIACVQGKKVTIFQFRGGTDACPCCLFFFVTLFQVNISLKKMSS